MEQGHEHEQKQEREQGQGQGHIRGQQEIAMQEHEHTKKEREHHEHRAVAPYDVQRTRTPGTRKEGADVVVFGRGLGNLRPLMLCGHCNIKESQSSGSVGGHPRFDSVESTPSFVATRPLPLSSEKPSLKFYDIYC